jgi:hypothetical protein
MKSFLGQSIHVLLALFILAAAVTPACAGGEQCSMPCCRNKARSVAQHPADTTSKACCTHPADASSAFGSSCRLDQRDLAINYHERTNPTPVAEGVADAAWTAAPDPACPLPRSAHFPEPPKAPLFLRIQLLLI